MILVCVGDGKSQHALKQPFIFSMFKKIDPTDSHWQFQLPPKTQTWMDQRAKSNKNTK